ncbi:MAG: MoaD/ThiS family protein [Desulfobacterales bacterium]|nr:MoaD/ThiS family protein [Desulfobacterales bacterium]
MTIKILFFAQLKDAFGTGERTIEIQEGLTVGEAVQALFKEAGVSRLKGLPVLYSVNEDFTDENRELKDNDTLALLPPVAGG